VAHSPKKNLRERKKERETDNGGKILKWKRKTVWGMATAIHVGEQEGLALNLNPTHLFTNESGGKQDPENTGRPVKGGGVLGRAAADTYEKKRRVILDRSKKRPDPLGRKLRRPRALPEKGI